LARDNNKCLAVSEAVHNNAADSWCFDTATTFAIAVPETFAQVYVLADS